MRFSLLSSPLALLIYFVIFFCSPGCWAENLVLKKTPKQMFDDAYVDMSLHKNQPSTPETRDLLIASAEAGYAPAQRALAICYEGGKGVPKDKVKAAYWRVEYLSQALQYDPRMSDNFVDDWVMDALSGKRMEEEEIAYKAYCYVICYEQLKKTNSFCIRKGLNEFMEGYEFLWDGGMVNLSGNDKEIKRKELYEESRGLFASYENKFAKLGIPTFSDQGGLLVKNFSHIPKLKKYVKYVDLDMSSPDSWSKEDVDIVAFKKFRMNEGEDAACADVIFSLFFDCCSLAFYEKKRLHDTDDFLLLDVEAPEKWDHPDLSKAGIKYIKENPLFAPYFFVLYYAKEVCAMKGADALSPDMLYSVLNMHFNMEQKEGICAEDIIKEIQSKIISEKGICAGKAVSDSYLRNIFVSSHENDASFLSRKYEFYAAISKKLGVKNDLYSIMLAIKVMREQKIPFEQLDKGNIN